ncbi:MAG: nucleoside deaminase [bacterium]|nr:nucleoside deaminase [bacterium]
MMELDKSFMELAIAEAIKAHFEGDYPVGAVLVDASGKLISKQGNRIIRDENPAGHAEFLCLIEAAAKFKNRILPNGCTIYTTHEPCPMCASMAVWTKPIRLIFGATINDMSEFRQNNPDKLNGFNWRTINISCQEVLKRSEPGENIKLIGSFMREECLKLFYL